jgi:glycosyltransferase involved in cell wall biosynthesis
LNTDQENIKAMTITVFTPTYNRAQLIKNLYDSLCAQTFKDFEWIIVDDGSTDDTQAKIALFIIESKIDIKYIKQQNKGKHFAINKGVSVAQGTLFFNVDSDDKLPPKSLETINYYHQQYKDKNNYGGVAGRKSYFDGRFVGSQDKINVTFTNAIKIRYKYKIKGDLAEVFLTDVIKQYPFPEIENEKFCPEVVVWNRIAQKYNLAYFPESTYMCEYQTDGLTAKIVKIRMRAPQATMICYAELSKNKLPWQEIIKANINFWRFSFNSKLNFLLKIKMISIAPTIVGLPSGFAMYIIDKIKQR